MCSELDLRCADVSVTCESVGGREKRRAMSNLSVVTYEHLDDSLTFPENSEPETTTRRFSQGASLRGPPHSTTKAQQLPRLGASRRLEEPHLRLKTPSRRKPEIRSFAWDHSAVLSKEHTKLGTMGSEQGASLR